MNWKPSLEDKPKADKKSRKAVSFWSGFFCGSILIWAFRRKNSASKTKVHAPSGCSLPRKLPGYFAPLAEAQNTISAAILNAEEWGRRFWDLKISRLKD